MSPTKRRPISLMLFHKQSGFVFRSIWSLQRLPTLKGYAETLPASVDGEMATWKLLSVPSKNCPTSSGSSDNHLNVKWAMATKTRSQFARRSVNDRTAPEVG